MFAGVTVTSMNAGAEPIWMYSRRVTAVNAEFVSRTTPKTWQGLNVLAGSPGQQANEATVIYDY